MAIGANKVEIEAYLAERGARDEKITKENTPVASLLFELFCSIIS